MMAIGMGDTCFIVDVGVMFPDNELLGVDLVIPDMSYVFKNKERIKAVFLTHGHEDHIGALPYLLAELQVPVYGSRLTLGMCRHRLEEHKLADSTELNTVAPGETQTLGPFQIHFIRVSHSLADSMALAIDTPHGRIIHTGDFKFDQSPVVGEPIDMHRLAAYGEQGVLALLSDSTNAEVAGHTGSEKDVTPAFEEIISRTPFRVFVACFTSSTPPNPIGHRACGEIRAQSSSPRTQHDPKRSHRHRSRLHSRSRGRSHQAGGDSEDAAR